jgi:hypothetical protein
LICALVLVGGEALDPVVGQRVCVVVSGVLRRHTQDCW